MGVDNLNHQIRAGKRRVRKKALSRCMKEARICAKQNRTLSSDWMWLGWCYTHANCIWNRRVLGKSFSMDACCTGCAGRDVCAWRFSDGFPTVVL